jgi:hypothetical protein
MNCQSFEPTVNDLARGRMMEANLRADALKHAEECERCCERLADERALSFNLRAFASSVDAMQAPAPVEAMLREAFRKRQATAAPTPLIAITQARARLWTAWATAAAAAILTVFALQAFRLRETHAPLLKANNSSSSLSDIKALRPMSLSAKPADEMAMAKDERASPMIVPKGVTVRQVSASRYAPVSARSYRTGQPVQANQAEAEIVTDFMPLTYGAALNPNEGGQLVRVELPRSALASLGLPMNVERSDERVKADVLLGHDGLARAIRFVR